MKKKIIGIIVSITIFITVIFTSFFTIFNNIIELDKIKTNLKNYSDFLITNDLLDIENIHGLKLNESNINCEYFNSNGKIIFEDINNSNIKFNKREEIEEAIKKGSGYSVRIYDGTNSKKIYYATKLQNNKILVLSTPYKGISLINSDNILYWILLIVFLVVLAIAFSMRIINIILEPLKELENVTDKISKGDLNKRVNVNSNDEIGSLGKIFNNMAEQLQLKIKEVVDKQDRLESILSSMQSGVIAVNKDNNLLIINPYAKKLFGVKQYILGKNVEYYIKDKSINNLIKSTSEEELETKIKYPVERTLKIKKTNLIDRNNVIGKVLAISDITEVKKLENMRSEFVANVTHELKTPLTSIKGFTETLRDVDDKEVRNKFLDIIDKETTRLTRLINDILVLSKLESSTESEVEEFYPKTIIEEIVDSLKTMAEGKNINLKLEKNTTVKITGSKDKFHQLVLNLIENAIKYTNNDKNVYVRSYVKNDKYIFEVEDEGIGIPKESLDRIFERFYRVDKSRKGNSTGLGLAIVKHIVKTFNGNIKVESEVNKGSKFIVSLNI